MGFFSFLRSSSTAVRQAVLGGSSSVNAKIKPVVLVILDGWGIAPPSKGNVIAATRLRNLESYTQSYPSGELIAAGESVGLPANEVGNTEVGHLTIGTGRVTYQGLKRINVSIEDGSFLRNPAFLAAVDHAKANNSKLHLMGILSSGNVHGSLNHFYALLEVCRRTGLNKVFIHAFTDGRDAPPHEAVDLFAKLQEHMTDLRIGQFASVSGRYYAMDRDLRWERTQKAYQAIVEGKGTIANSALEAVQVAYQKGLSDELLEPTVIMSNGQPVATVDNHDAVISFNFRIDRPRQLAMALALPGFEQLDLSTFGYTDSKTRGKAVTSATFSRGKIPENLFLVTMTNYHSNISVNAIAFEASSIPQSLGKTLADNQLLQMRMSESEKERFVTYYFNGCTEDVYPGEEHSIVPSPKVATYDLKPEMSLGTVLSEFKKHLGQDKYHFFAMNIANPDMVAHTGNIPATIKACLETDKAVGEIVRAVLARSGTVFLTADHGNAEELITYPTSSFFFTSSRGTVNTDHSNNPVPFIVISNSLRGQARKLPNGSLSDIAPTILKYMGLTVPEEMTGKDILA